MTDIRSKIRLFVETPLGPDVAVPLGRDQAHYLFNVMRRGKGDCIALFDGVNGEWLAEIVEAGKRAGVALCVAPSAPQVMPPDLWLMFAPIKKARTDFIVEKATEMGAAKILPVMTQYTNAERLRPEKLRAHAVEAAEQCGGTFVPEVCAPVKLEALLANWDPARRIMFCDEARNARAATLALQGMSRGPWAILIGPEGGFSPDEAAKLHAMDCVVPVTLGPRILRADTAAVAALALWQSVLGDW